MSGPPDEGFGLISSGVEARREENLENIIAPVLDKPREATKEQVAQFLNVATDEDKQNLFDSLGVDINNFYDSIEQQVANYPTIYRNETRLVGSDPNYSSSTTIDAIRAEYKDEVEDIVLSWFLENKDSDVSVRFDDFITDDKINQQIKTKIVEDLIKEKGFIASLFAFLGAGEAPPNTAQAAERIKKIVDGSPEPDDPKEKEKKAENISDAEAKQCVLLNLLSPLSDLCDQALKAKTLDEAGNTIGFPYSGRVVKLDTKNPTSFMNYLSNVPGINSYLTKKEQDSDEYISADNMINYYRLSFIKKHKGVLYELPIIYEGGFNFNTINAGIVGSETATGADFSSEINSDENDGDYGYQRTVPEPSENSTITVQPSSELSDTISEEINDFKIDISYQGSNPSTYRNDVDVKITFTAPTLNTFLQKWTYDGIQDENNQPIPFSLFDLILFPYLEKDAEGYGKVYKSQYSPNYNRIRLAYASGFESGGGRGEELINFYNKNSNVLDLAVVDHEFKREEEGTRYVLSITYKGYVQSVLTSPETDVLSTPEIKRKRETRDTILKAAIQKDCSLREIQKIQTQLNKLAKNDVMDVNYGIMASLYYRFTKNVMGLGIYKLNADKALDDALSAGDEVILDQVKKRIVDPDNNQIARNFVPDNVSSLAQIQEQDDTDNFVNRADSNNIYFFYLADLLDAALLNSGIFKQIKLSDDEINPDIIAQKIRFIMGSFVDPNNNVINIGNIPISVDFFLDWYNETITKKELFIYPCLSFIRDITEKVLTNMLNRVCFEGLEETKLLVRTSFLPGVTKNKSDPLFDYYIREYVENDKLKVNIDNSQLNSNDFPLIKTDFQANILDYVNYCTIFTRENNLATNLGRKVEIPTFFLEYDPIRFGVKTSSFSRVQQTGLRESRLFRNSQSGITMLASVYNVDLELTHPIHFIYPGQFFKIDIYSDPQFSITVGGDTRPIFEELGLNGFYAVTKVNTTIDARSKKLTTKVSGIFIGTESPYSVRKLNPNSQGLEAAPPTPQQIACNDFVELAEEIGVLEATGAGEQGDLDLFIENILSFAEEAQEIIQQAEEISPQEFLPSDERIERANEAAEDLTEEEIDEINDILGSRFS